MELVPRGLRITFLGVVALALMGGQAQAVTYNFTVTPTPPNEDQVTTFRLTPSTASVRQVMWDLDGDGFYDDGFTREVTRTYANPGSVTVRMRAREDTGEPFQTVTKTVVVNGSPTASFTSSPTSPLEGQAVSFAGSGTDAQGDSLAYSWSFGDGTGATGAAAGHAFAKPGTYSVALTVTDEYGAFAKQTQPVTVRADPGPSAAFSFAPAAPLTDDTVTFTSASTPSHGAITSLDWDLDGDGAFDDATGATATWTYATAGTRMVGLRVQQANGKQGVAFRSVSVAQRPPPPPPPAPPPVGPVSGVPLPPAPLVRMRPFPIVRIAGVVLPTGARITILSVRAPRGARVSARCIGRGCPVRSIARTSRMGIVRLHRYERRLRAGTKLELAVRKPGTIGKFTRFVIRAGKPPARTDRCLMPGRTRPVACP